MFTALTLDTLVSNKYLWAALAAFAAAGFVYVRGYKKGSASEAAKNSQAFEEIQKRLVQVATENHQVDRKREQDENAVDSAPNVDSLLRLWDDANEKSTGPDSRPDPK